MKGNKSGMLRAFALVASIALIPACGDKNVTIMSGSSAGTQTLSIQFGDQGSFGGGIVPQVLFLSEAVNDANPDVFATTLDGAVRVNLSKVVSYDDVYNDKEVSGFAWSPDHAYVAYHGNLYNESQEEIWIVPATGGTPVRTIPNPQPGQNVAVGSYAWAPNGSRLALMVDANTEGVFELFTVRPDGTGLVKVSGTLPTGGDVTSFAWAPDSSRIAYVADQDVNDDFELYTVLPDGTGNVQVSGTLVTGGDVTSFAWASDSSRLVYAADQRFDNASELFSTSPTASDSVQISGPMGTQGAVSGVVVR